MDTASLSQKLSGCSKELSNIIQKMNWDDETLSTFDRNDLNEVLPGNEFLLVRKKAFKIIETFKNKANIPTDDSPLATSLPTSSTKLKHHEVTERSCSKKLTLVATPVFEVYTDEELRRYQGGEELPKNLQTRLCQSIISNMISTCQNLEFPRYPLFTEVEQMAQKLCKLYPGLMDQESHVVFYEKMKRRLQNVRPAKKPQGKTPKRSKFFRAQLSEKTDENSIPATNLENLTPISEPVIEHHKKKRKVYKSLDPCEERNVSSLEKELGKRQPDPTSIQLFMDLLFTKRRTDINNCQSVQERVNYVNSQFPALKQYAPQILEEVRRILDYSNEKFVDEVTDRFENLIKGLSFYAKSKFENVVYPPKSNVSERFVILLPLMESLFESGKGKKEGKKKKSSTILVVEINEDPEKARCKRPSDGMPGYMLDKNVMKCVVLVGKDIFSMHDNLLKGFLSFMGLFYVLDVDYPPELAMTLSMFHRHAFSDNRVCQQIIENFDAVSQEVEDYLLSD